MKADTPNAVPIRSILPPELVEAWEERVAICVIDGGLTEAEAEIIADQEAAWRLAEWRQQVRNSVDTLPQRKIT